MGLLTMLAWVQALTAAQPERLGLPQGMAPRRAGPGPQAVLTLEVRRRLAEQVDGRKRDIDTGRVRFEHGYGDKCSDVAAIRSLALDEYRQRLIREGAAPQAAERTVEEYSRTSEFRRHVNAHKVALSRVRSKATESPLA